MNFDEPKIAFDLFYFLKEVPIKLKKNSKCKVRILLKYLKA